MLTVLNMFFKDCSRLDKELLISLMCLSYWYQCHTALSVRNIEDIVADVPRRNNTRTRNVSETTNTSDSGDEDERKSLLNSGQQPCVQQDSCNAEERRRCESLLQSYSFLQVSVTCET